MSTSLALSSVSTSIAPKSYLQFAEEELSPDILASYNRESILWKVAAVATIVAFSVIMVGAFVATAFYFPIAIPLVGIGSLLLLDQVLKVYSMFEGWADAAGERVTQLSTINKHYEALDGSTPHQLQEILREKGIHYITGMQDNDPQLTTLKPLIARHLFWEGHVEGLDKKKTEKFKLAEKLSNEGFVENREEIYDVRGEGLEFEKQALESKVKNAFINAVLRRPHFKGTLEDLGTFSPLSGQERALAMQSNAPKANEFFTFTNSVWQPLKYEDVKRYYVTDLAMRMVAVM